MDDRCQGHIDDKVDILIWFIWVDIRYRLNNNIIYNIDIMVDRIEGIDMVDDYFFQDFKKVKMFDI